MKKLIFIFIAVIAFGCGDGSNRSSESNESQTEDNYPSEPVEPDSSEMQMDTTSTPGQGVDTVSNNN